jgi:hypothetical protein
VSQAEAQLGRLNRPAKWGEGMLEQYGGFTGLGGVQGVPKSDDYGLIRYGVEELLTGLGFSSRGLPGFVLKIPGGQAADELTG